MYKTPVIKTPQKSRGTGAFGEYYKLSNKVGVKVLKKKFSKNKVIDSYIDFLNKIAGYFYDSRYLEEAARELAALRMLKRSGKTPKPIGLCWVKSKKDKFKIGIMMEHIDGKTLSHWHNCRKTNAEEEVSKMEVDYTYDWYRKFGIKVKDWHQWNILVEKKNGRRVRIDLSPDYFEISKKRQKEFFEIVHNEVINLVENFPA